MVYISTKALVGIAYLCLPIFAQADVGAESTEIICEPDNPTDCYPRIFVPTEKFQIIRKGQDIPPALHVRLNIYTGLKEARLNVPMEGEEEEGSTIQIQIPEGQDVAVVEQPEEAVPETKSESGSEPEKPALRDQVPLKAPVYESAGRVVPPPPGTDDIGTFQTAMVMVQMDSRAFDHGLDNLVELSHDIYYGVEIVKSGPVLEKLICLLLGAGTEAKEAKERERDHKAAQILSAALQNNPTALKEVEDSWKLVLYPSCATDYVEGNTKSKSPDFVSKFQNQLGKERDPAVLRTKVTAISHLLKVQKFRSVFLEKKGMELLLAIFLKKGDKWDGVKKKVSQLVADNFLDETMGAELGTWPTGPIAGDTVCQTKGKMLQDGCWEYHVQAYGKERGGSSWEEDFLSLLNERRGKVGARDREL